MDIKGFPQNTYIPDGRNAGYIEYIHGGVARNVVEDIANLGLNSTFVGIVDNTALGKDVKQHLQNRNVNTDYMKSIENGMGTWLAVFDHNGELAGSVSQRPDLMPIYSILEEYGDILRLISLSFSSYLILRFPFLFPTTYDFHSSYMYVLELHPTNTSIIAIAIIDIFCFIFSPTN